MCEVSDAYYVHVGLCVRLLSFLWDGIVIVVVIVRIFVGTDWFKFGPDQSLGQVWIGPVCHSGGASEEPLEQWCISAVVGTGPVFQHYFECPVGVGTVPGNECWFFEFQWCFVIVFCALLFQCPAGSHVEFDPSQLFGCLGHAVASLGQVFLVLVDHVGKLFGIRVCAQVAYGFADYDTLACAGGVVRVVSDIQLFVCGFNVCSRLQDVFTFAVSGFLVHHHVQEYHLLLAVLVSELD